METDRREVLYSEEQFRDGVAKAVADLETLPGYAPISACIIGRSLSATPSRVTTWMTVVGRLSPVEISRYSEQADSDLRTVSGMHTNLWEGGNPVLHKAYPAGASWAGFGVAITGRTGEQSAQLLALLILKHVAGLGFEQATRFVEATANHVIREHAQRFFGMVA